MNRIFEKLRAFLHRVFRAGSAALRALPASRSRTGDRDPGAPTTGSNVGALPGLRLVRAAMWIAALAAVALLARSWFDARDARVHLEATLATQKALLDQAAARERDRAEQLRRTLGEIEAVKARVHTPQEAAREIPRYLPPLPLPIEIKLPEPAPRGGASKVRLAPAAPPVSNADSARASGANASPDAASEAAPPAIATIPQQDLKPLFDAMQRCRACAAQLDSAQGDLSDERAKNLALTAERDAAVKAARGGGFWPRVKRSAKWFAIGVGVGAALAHR